METRNKMVYCKKHAKLWPEIQESDDDTKMKEDLPPSRPKRTNSVLEATPF
jgi:hypothetical protein